MIKRAVLGQPAAIILDTMRGTRDQTSPWAERMHHSHLSLYSFHFVSVSTSLTLLLHTIPLCFLNVTPLYSINAYVSWLKLSYSITQQCLNTYIFFLIFPVNKIFFLFDCSPLQWTHVSSTVYFCLVVFLRLDLQTLWSWWK